MANHLYKLLILLVLTSCGSVINHRSPIEHGDSETELAKQVAYLQEIVVSFVNASDYTDCNAGTLSPMELKICQIAQAATAEQSVLFYSRLGELGALIQHTLYGSDCVPDELNTFLPDCPSGTSVLGQIAAHSSDIILLQAQVASLVSSIAALDTRMGTAESSITAINTTITALDARIDALEDTINSSDVFQTVELCGDTTPTTGPVFEAVLLTSTHDQIVAFAQSGSKRGLSVLRTGTETALYTTTNLNTLACRIKIYTHQTGSNLLNVCWHNTNRSATEAQINAQCDPNANGQISDKTSLCTCGY